jgi:seryl-tRNA synthetase
MAPPGFDNLINKVKSVTKQAADTTARQAKIVKLRMNLTTLQTEKSRHLQTIGIRVQEMYTSIQKLDGDSLYEKVKDELAQLSRIDTKIGELEAEIAQIQASANAVEVSDVTEDVKEEEPPKS